MHVLDFPTSEALGMLKFSLHFLRPRISGSVVNNRSLVMAQSKTVFKSMFSICSVCLKTELTAPERATCPRGSSLDVGPELRTKRRTVPWASYLLEEKDEQLMQK